jgi:hypothetical protein
MNFNRTDLIWMTGGFPLCVIIQPCSALQQLESPIPRRGRQEA